MNVNTLLEVILFLSIIMFFVKKMAKEFEDDIKKEQFVKKKVASIRLVENDVSVLSKIKEIDNNFNEEFFLKGAKEAFKMIVSSFNKNEIDSIKNYISKDIYKSFNDVVLERKANKLISVFELVGFEKTEIKDMKLTGNIASITVEFVSEQASYLKDEDDNVISGTPNYIKKVTDIWIFSKDLKSKDPNWTLIATQNI